MADRGEWADTNREVHVRPSGLASGAGVWPVCRRSANTAWLQEVAKATLAADRMDGLRMPQALLTNETWRCVWEDTMCGGIISWATIGAGLRLLDDDMVDALGEGILVWLRDPEADGPAAWEIGRSAFIPKSFSREFGKFRPIVPLGPVMAVSTQAVLLHNEGHKHPTWL